MARAIFISGVGVIAAGVLRGWLEAGNEVAEIWVSSLRSLGRQRGVTRFAPNWSVAALSKRHGVPVFANPPLKDWSGVAEHVGRLEADVLISAMTMQIIPAAVLDLFGARAVNFHPALLPDYRGASPFVGMLLDSRADICGGITLHQLTPAIDKGPIIAQRAATPGQGGYVAWGAAVAGAARLLARDSLGRYLSGDIEAVPQRGGSYRRVRDELQLGPATALANARHVLGAIGDSSRVWVALPGGRKAIVRALTRVEGAPSGAPARLRPGSVSLDLADARVTLRRHNEFDKLRDRIALLRALLQQDRAAQE